MEKYIYDDQLPKLATKYQALLTHIKTSKKILLDNSFTHGTSVSNAKNRLLENITPDLNEIEYIKQNLIKIAFEIYPPPNAKLLRKKALEYLETEPIVVTEYDIKSVMMDLKKEMEQELQQKREEWVHRNLQPYLKKYKQELREIKNNNCCNWCGKPLGKSVKYAYGADLQCCASCKEKGLDKYPPIYGKKEQVNINNLQKLNEGVYFKKTGKPAVQPYKNPNEKYYLLDSPKSEWGFIVRHEDPEGKAIFSFNKSSELIDYINKTIFNGNDEDSAYVIAKDLAEEYHNYTGPIIYKYEK
jgi:hypothetical protein